MNIGEKLFTYIDVSADLSQEMVDKYKNSLIFLGDEQQIFQPLTGTYIGIGLSRFNQVIQELSNNTDLLNHFDDHIHQNVVNSIWAEYSAEEFNSVFIDSSVTPKYIAGSNRRSGEPYELMTNQDVVIKGLHDTTGTEARTADELGYPYDSNVDFTYNQKFWAHINRTSASNSNYKGSSGIQVNVHHTGNYKVGRDEQGFSYSYWEGHDYLTIDDHLTWAYITSQSSYLMEFSKRIAISQANRVYHDILGGNNPVYIEKEFDEVFDYNDDGELVNIIANSNDPNDIIGDVYIHARDDSSTGTENGGIYQKVYIHNDSDYYYIYSQFIDPTTGNPIYYIVDTNNPSPTTLSNVNIGSSTITINTINQNGLMNLLHPDDGWDKNSNGTFKSVAWYNIDADATAQGQARLADGIQTLKEVTYILDQITDGSDAGITLTYNIAQNAIDIANLKNWQSTIGEHVVTDFNATSSNRFTYVNSYSINKWNDSPSIGEVRMDIDLLVAQTYTITINSTPVSYAAYLNNASHTNHIAPIWRFIGDETNDNYYKNVGTFNSTQLNQLITDLTQIFGNPNTHNITIYTKYINSTTGESEYTPRTTTTTNGLSSMTFNNDDYILFNYEKIDYPIVNGKIDALTTVDWVTTYVGWGISNALNQMSMTNDDVKTYFMTYIHDNLTYTDSDYAGQYVSKVDQRDGKIIVTHKVLPLNTILASQEIFGNDFFVPISINQANEIYDDDNNSFDHLYYLNGFNYEHPTGLNPNEQYYILGSTNRFTKLNTSSITNQNDPIELTAFTYQLLVNDGELTYFRRVGNGTVDLGTTSTANVSSIMKYVPVDINDLLTNVSDPYLPYSILSELYYYAGTTSSSKYIDISYRQNTDTGATEINVTSYVTYLGAATSSNTGLADAYDVRKTIENMLSWVNLKTNKFMN